MQSIIDLKDPFSYNFIYIVIIFIILLFLLILFLITNMKKQNKPLKVIPPKDINAIKNKYLQTLEELLKKVSNNEITIRKAYQHLSFLIRSFIFEATSIDVLKCTLTDIRKLKIDILSELVAEYYEPEFSKNTKSDIVASIEKGRGVILKWN